MSAVATVSSLHCFKKGINLVPPVPIVLDEATLCPKQPRALVLGSIGLSTFGLLEPCCFELEGKIMYLVTI